MDVLLMDVLLLEVKWKEMMKLATKQKHKDCYELGSVRNSWVWFISFSWNSTLCCDPCGVVRDRAGTFEKKNSPIMEKMDQK